MLGPQELTFAKIAILNKLITKDQFFKTIRLRAREERKQHIGVIMEQEGFLTSEEVQRIMQSLSVIFSTQDRSLRKRREKEINFALAAQKDGYVSTDEMSSVLMNLQARAEDPEATLEDILREKEYMTDGEIKKVKSTRILREDVLEGVVAAEDDDEPLLDTAQFEAMTKEAETRAEQEPGVDDEQEEEIEFVKTRGSAVDFDTEEEMADLETEVVELTPRKESVEDDTPEVEATIVSEEDEAKKPAKKKTAKKKKPAVVQKWKIAVMAFGDVVKIARAEKRRVEKQMEKNAKLVEEISEMTESLKELQKVLRKHKMTKIPTPEFQDTLKKSKKLEGKIVKLMRAGRDRGRKAGRAAEKIKKSMHRAGGALRVRGKKTGAR